MTFDRKDYYFIQITYYTVIEYKTLLGQDVHIEVSSGFYIKWGKKDSFCNERFVHD